jgi:hypothetical protein
MLIALCISAEGGLAPMQGASPLHPLYSINMQSAIAEISTGS